VCNQYIYSERHRERRPADFNRVHAGAPLRCVQYRIGDGRFRFDEAGFQRWLTTMEARFALAGRETYALPRYDRHDAVVVTVDHIDVLTFVPRPGTQSLHAVASNARRHPESSQSAVNRRP
jgi:hypothetical protein